MSMYATGRSRFPDKTRIALLERDGEDTSSRLTSVESMVDSHETKIAVMGARLGIYVAVAGGGVGLVTAIVTAFVVKALG